MSLPLERQLAYLRLARTEQIGPVTFQRLMKVYGEPDKALAALPELSQRGGRQREPAGSGPAAGRQRARHDGSSWLP